LALGVLTAVAAAPDEGRPADELPELPRPEPLDLSLPAQEAFRDWPPDALIERPYWLPWTIPSFQRATLFGRPIVFVMAVRWNHASQRMMNGTLSDPRVLTAVNDLFVPVLVNPDRRPDLRERYQTGTWPVVAFLLPNGNPIISKVNEARQTRPITTGLIDVDPMLFMLREADKYYNKLRVTLFELGEAWVQRASNVNPMTPGEVNLPASDKMARWLLANADRQDGGFGMAPKFVVPGLYEYAALRQARLVPALEEQARLTLEKMVQGPLYDRKDGGVHRMAVAPQWGQLQYEKMLEANAWLLRDLVLAVRREDSETLRQAIAGTASFMTGPLAREGGGFYLAQIADPDSEDGGGYWRGETDQAPPADPQVLTGLNAIAGAAVLRAGALLGDESLEAAGRAALDLVLATAYERGRGVDHLIEPNPENHRFVWSQADAAFGLLDAHQVTGDPRYLDAARDIVDFVLNNLTVGNSRLFLDRLPDPIQIGLLENPRFPMRPNVRLVRAMLRLFHLGQGEIYFERALHVLSGLTGDLSEYQVLGAEAALAVEEAVSAPLHVRILGDPSADATRALRRAATNLPTTWTIVSTGDAASPVAELELGGKTVRVDDPSGLASAAAGLLDPGRTE
jgi:uncharacterized protein YyaL (SSP411 family)